MSVLLSLLKFMRDSKKAWGGVLLADHKQQQLNS